MNIGHRVRLSGWISAGPRVVYAKDTPTGVSSSCPPPINAGPDQALLLFETVLPVHYQIENLSNLVTNVQLTPPSPNILLYGQVVNLNFQYTADQPGGVRIFARPISQGALTPDYAAHGSPIYPVGSGNGTGFFTINSGPALVDGIRLSVTNADQSLLLYETIIPVHYQFGPFIPPAEVSFTLHLPVVTNP